MIELRNISALFLARAVAMLLLGLATLAAAAEPAGGGRWLLIFDTSATMKKFLPGTEAALKNFLATSADGQLQPGDSVGVWLMNQQVNAQFPTFNWSPAEAGTFVKNLGEFMKRQPFAAPSQLAGMSSSLNYVVANSRRLTVVIFTDGQSAIAGTTYDDGVNQMFRDTVEERRKEAQPIAVVLRSQLGKYVGCTINYPPGPVNLPPFPPPPAPPVVTNLPVVKPANTAAQAAPSLVIVGTAVSTNGTDPVPTPKTNPPVVKPVMVVTNPPVAPVTQAVAVAVSMPVTNPVVFQQKAVPPPVVPVIFTSSPPSVATMAPPVAASVNTNPPASARPAELEKSNRTLLFIGAGGLGVLAAVAVFGVRRRRRPQSSLISSSMQDEQRRR